MSNQRKSQAARIFMRSRSRTFSHYVFGRLFAQKDCGKIMDNEPLVFRLAKRLNDPFMFGWLVGVTDAEKKCPYADQLSAEKWWQGYAAGVTDK